VRGDKIRIELERPAISRLSFLEKSLAVEGDSEKVVSGGRSGIDFQAGLDLGLSPGKVTALDGTEAFFEVFLRFPVSPQKGPTGESYGDGQREAKDQAAARRSHLLIPPPIHLRLRYHTEPS
jgi:hypothetical protein